jgi:hypothetical protein
LNKTLYFGETMKILDVTPYMGWKKQNGGCIVHKRNLAMLQNIYGNQNVDLFEMPKPTVFTRIKNISFSESYSQTLKTIQQFKRILKKNYDFIFFDQSLFPSFVKIAKENGTKVIVFYHNIEKNYYYDRLQTEKKLAIQVFYSYITRIEKQTTEFADFRIVLNSRDAEELKRNYNKTADLIIPITMKNNNKKIEDINQNGKYGLFLGNNFFPNQEGCSWFIEKVLPYIKFDVHFAGTISDYLEKKYGKIEHVHYDGYVDDLDKTYNEAAFIFSPIFHGSGMKTKTIEALSYGKTIFGTQEAFVGIDADFNKIGALCNSENDFIKAINSLNVTTSFNSYSYDLFKNNFTDEIVQKKFEAFILKTLVNSGVNQK